MALGLGSAVFAFILCSQLSSLQQVSSIPDGAVVRGQDLMRERRNAQGNPFLCTPENNEILDLHWQNELIPYSIDKNLTGAERKNILRVLHQWEETSCFIFVPRHYESQFISFAGNTAANSCCVKSISTSTAQCHQLQVSSCTPLMISDLIGSVLMTGATPQATHNKSAVQELVSGPDDPLDSDVEDSTSCRETCGGVFTPNISQGYVFEGGIIQTPNFPSQYPPHLDCTWKIWAPEGYSLRLRFQSMSIEMGNCMYDYLDVSNLDAEGEMIRKRNLCGSPSISDLNADTDSSRKVDQETAALILHFHSDDTYMFMGFRVTYELIDKVNFPDPCSHDNGGCDHVCVSEAGGRHSCSCREGYSLNIDGKTCSDIDECAEKKGGCQHKCRNTAGSYFCSCRAGYRLYNMTSCIKCIQDLSQEPAGHISSQHFPAPYTHMHNCMWTLNPWPHHRLRLTLHHLDVLPSEKCRTDYLKLPSGHFPNQRRLCGHHFNITYVTDKWTRVRFHTQSANVFHTGFKLSYEQVPEEQLTELDLGYVKVGGTYLPYQKRHWI